MFTTGFTMNPDKVAESMQGTTVEWMKTMRKPKNAAITGSVVIEDHYYITECCSFFFHREIQFYDKRHLFTLAGEEVYTAGDDKLIIDYLGWKICPLFVMICDSLFLS
jgi:predicted amidohydrolase